MALQRHVEGVSIHYLGNSTRGFIRRAGCRGDQKQQGRQKMDLSSFMVSFSSLYVIQAFPLCKKCFTDIYFRRTYLTLHVVCTYYGRSPAANSATKEGHASL